MAAAGQASQATGRSPSSRRAAARVGAEEGVLGFAHNRANVCLTIGQRQTQKLLSKTAAICFAGVYNDHLACTPTAEELEHRG